MSEPEAAEEGSRRRLILHEFLSLQECKELAHPFGLATDPMFSRPLSRTSSPPKLIRTYLSGCSDSHNILFSLITDGERLTLALCFSRDASYDEDN
ncbi:hypothetical protein DVH24_040272 [Malus domestica]|uniref:Uncharacterized protein n=1 Tax=Malus domestica TaxID=3750 RepID=A0A498IAY1_MALDO|nr:hypothetical protein DVH24_040272 [Malus domestica]